MVDEQRIHARVMLQRGLALLNNILYTSVCLCVCHVHASLPPFQKAGKKLQALVGNESVCFYVSPFLRSRETQKYLREGFHDEQVQFNITLLLYLYGLPDYLLK